MLIEFRVRNFRSIRDEAVLSFEATHLVAKSPDVEAATTFVAPDGRKLLRSAAIFGANASGKSNVVVALSLYFLAIVKSTDANNSILTALAPFGLGEAPNVAPTLVEARMFRDGKWYRYGFEVASGTVVREWLFDRPRKRERVLFERCGSEVEVSPSFPEGEGLGARTRTDTLFLSVCAQFNGPTALRLVDLATGPVASFTVGNDVQVGTMLTAGLSRVSPVASLLRVADTGIEEIRVRSGDGQHPPVEGGGDAGRTWGHAVRTHGLVVESVRRVATAGGGTREVVFRLDRDESMGTRRVFEVAGLLLMALSSGTPCILDELDARLHPALTRKIVELFHSTESNPKNAQLVFTTHDTHLLDPDLFRRDQIWFTEKTSDGNTELYSLAEVKGVREAEAWERAYLSGRYGAVPILNRFAEAVKGRAAE